LALAEWRGQKEAPTALHHADGRPEGISDMATVLLGDPVQKAVIAWRAGREDGAQRGRERGWMAPYLLVAMEDIYPASRRFAWRSLMQILDDWPEPKEVEGLASSLQSFDFMAEEGARSAMLARIGAQYRAIDKSRWPAPPPNAHLNSDYELPGETAKRLVLLGRRADKQISIGE
jgi:hypothetical protein